MTMEEAFPDVASVDRRLVEVCHPLSTSQGPVKAAWYRVVDKLLDRRIQIAREEES